MVQVPGLRQDLSRAVPKDSREISSKDRSGKQEPDNKQYLPPGDISLSEVNGSW